MASLIRDTVLPHLTVSVDPTTGIVTSTANVSGIISRDLEAARPRLLEFAEYLQSMSAEDRESLFAAQVAENSLKASDLGGGGYDYTSEVGGGAGGDSGHGFDASAAPSGGQEKPPAELGGRTGGDGGEGVGAPAVPSGGHKKASDGSSILQARISSDMRRCSRFGNTRLSVYCRLFY